MFQGKMRVCLLILLLSVLPDSFSKVQELKVDVDFPGDDVLQIYSPDVYHCQLACTQHHSCNFFTFIQSDWSRDSRNFYCYLKHTESGTPSVVTNLKGVTSGFSLSRKEYKTFSFLSSTYQDIDFQGSDYRQLSTHSYEECQKQCTSDPDCQFFSFTTDKFAHSEYRKKCFLKYSWTIPIPPVLVHTAGHVSGFSDLLYKAEGAKEECKDDTQADTDFPGNDFEHVPAASPQHCQFLCSKHPRCNHFSFVSSSMQPSEPGLNMRCYLKYKQDVSQVQSFKKEGVYSGYPTRNCKPSYVWATTRYKNLDFHGYDIREYTTAKSEICQDICTTDPDCQFYSHVPNRRKCNLKKVMTVPRPEKVVHLNGVVSGFSLRDYEDDLKAYLGAPECGKVRDERLRIFGGFAASEGDWPWQVSLSRGSKHFCGGSIINRRWIITAAHCLFRPYTQISVRAGLTKLSENGTEYDLETAIVHSEYDEDSFVNDIALIKTRKPITFDDYKNPICLMEATNEAKFLGKNCTVTGWGRMKSGSFPDVLQEAQVPLMTAEQCAAILSQEDLEPYKILSTNLCAGFHKGGIDTCDGDSGGPLVCEDENESTWYLAGVTSWGMGCGKPDSPGVYTRIMRYLPWIKNVIANEG